MQYSILKLFNRKLVFSLLILFAMANEAVLKYLVDTNRPYSCADVTVNLRGAFTKSAVQKALDYLSENAKIRCKLYGKQKVYAAIQAENVKEEGDTEDYDAQCKLITEELLEKTNTLKTVEANLKTILSTPTTDHAKSQIEGLTKKIEAYGDKLKVLSTSTNVISVEEKQIIMSQHEKFLKEYRINETRQITKINIITSTEEQILS